jgi:hypothetical protein
MCTRKCGLRTNCNEVLTDLGHGVSSYMRYPAIYSQLGKKKKLKKRSRTQPRGPAGSDAPSCVQGARFRVARGLLDPRLVLLRGRTRQQSTTGGYHRCAVGVRERNTPKAGFSTASALISKPPGKKKEASNYFFLGVAADVRQFRHFFNGAPWNFLSLAPAIYIIYRAIS